MGLVALAGFLAFVPLAVLVAMRCPFHRQPPVMPDANVESRQVLKHLTARYEDNSGKPKLLASQDALWACHSSKVKPIRTNWRGIRRMWENRGMTAKPELVLVSDSEFKCSSCSNFRLELYPDFVSKTLDQWKQFINRRFANKVWIEFQPEI